MKNLIAILLASNFLTSLALASEYTLGDCHISVKPGIAEKSIQIEAIKGNQFGKIVLDQITQQVTSINICNDALGSHENSISSQLEIINGKRTYTAKCGGAWEDVNGKASVTIDSTGRVSALTVKFKIARWGLPNGLNSGPIKFTSDHIICQ